MIKGYDKLSPYAKKVFNRFLKYYSADDKPIEVKETNKYLKLIFPNMWLHVINPHTWY